MAIAISLQAFLQDHPLENETLTHPYTQSSLRTAAVIGQSGDKVAKSVLLRDDDGYVLAILPATHRIHLGRLHHDMKRNLGLATELEVTKLFHDCKIGAIPPVGMLYDIDTVVDDSLLEQSDIYFEAGDHESMIHMDRKAFGQLVGDATHANFSYRM